MAACIPFRRVRPGADRPWRLGWLSLLAALTALAAPLAFAQDGPSTSSSDVQRFAPDELSGTLAKARGSGSIALGYRTDAVPFSYLGPRKEPIGYSVELCKALVSSIEDAISKSLTIKWVPIASENRISAVTSGQIDLECGSTTSNLERQKVASFSPIIFVAGTKVMVRKGSPIRSFRDLAGKKVAVTTGTTNEKALRDLDERFKLGLQLQVVPDHAQGFAQVADGRADAYASDDVLLYGLIAENAGKGGQFQVMGDYLSYEPYAIMFRKNDPQLAQVVKDSFQELADDGEIERQYKRWFLRKLPSGTSLDLPMSPQLDTIIQTTALKSE